MTDAEYIGCKNGTLEEAAEHLNECANGLAPDSTAQRVYNNAAEDIRSLKIKKSNGKLNRDSES